MITALVFSLIFARPELGDAATTNALRLYFNTASGYGSTCLVCARMNMTGTISYSYTPGVTNPTAWSCTNGHHGSTVEHTPPTQ